MNLPPDIIRKVACQIEEGNNIKIKDDIISSLEKKIIVLNKDEEKRQKEIELIKAAQESIKAKAMVEEMKLPPPKPSKIVEKVAAYQKEQEFKEPKPVKKAGTGKVLRECTKKVVSNENTQKNNG